MKVFKMVYALIAIGLLYECSSTSDIDRIPPEIISGSEKKVSSGFMAPLILTEEMKKQVELRNLEFHWKLDLNQREVESIQGIGNDPDGKKKLFQILENKFKPWQYRYIALLKLISFDLDSRQYLEASIQLQKYKSTIPEMDLVIQELISILNENESNVQISETGSLINQYNSYGPVPELSGRKLYYTSTKTPGGEGNEDILEVNRENGEWKERKFVKDLNTASNDSAISVSPDGTELIVFGNYSGSQGGGDIFFSKWNGKNWLTPENFGSPINTPYFESDGIKTPDGKALLFVSDRPGAYFSYQRKNHYFAGENWGNTDIYISLIKEDGTYSLPINLGPMINTPGAERTPFLHPDGQTLYFSSNGYNLGFGSLDLYKSIRLDNTWTKWSRPVHLGKILNTSGPDWGFRMTAVSDQGFISGISQKQKDNQIFEITPLPIRAKPENYVIAISGKIKDETGNPLEAEIEWQDLDTGIHLGNLKSKAGSGEFYITLPVGKHYAYFAKKPGHFSQSQNIDLSKEKSFQSLDMEISLISIEGATKSKTEIPLNNILFQSDSSELDTRSYFELDRLIEILKKNPRIKIEIQGHTSASNRPEILNLELSKKRAESVSTYLISKGVAKEKIRSRGYGSERPVLPNTTEENKKKNRRVTFIVTE